MFNVMPGKAQSRQGSPEESEGDRRASATNLATCPLALRDLCAFCPAGFGTDFLA